MMKMMMIIPLNRLLFCCCRGVYTGGEGGKLHPVWAEGEHYD